MSKKKKAKDRTIFEWIRPNVMVGDLLRIGIDGEHYVLCEIGRYGTLILTPERKPKGDE